MEKKVAKKKVATKTTKKVAPKTTKKVAPKTTKNKKKGFTLVELLAVIIILAVVVGISIPAVLNTINGSKNNAMGVAVTSAGNWLEQQVSLYSTSTGLADANFKDNSICPSCITALVSETGSSTVTLKASDASQKKMILAMGLKPDNVTEVTIQNKQNGKLCVTIKTIPNTSEYYTTEYWNVGTGTAGASNCTPKDNAKNKSAHC